MLSPQGQSGLASRTKFWPRSRPQTFSVGLGLKHLASACRRRTSSQEETDIPVCLPTTGHHSMIADSHCARENEKLNCVVLIINSHVCCQPSFDTFYSLLYLWPQHWPRRQEIGLGLGLKILASFNIIDLISKKP